MERKTLLYKIECTSLRNISLVDTIVTKEGSDIEKCIELCIVHSEKELYIGDNNTIFFRDLIITKKTITKTQHKDLISMDLINTKNNLIENGLWSILYPLENYIYHYSEKTGIDIWLDGSCRKKNNTDEELIGFLKYIEEELNVTYTLDEIKLAFKYGDI